MKNNKLLILFVILFAVSLFGSICSSSIIEPMKNGCPNTLPELKEAFKKKYGTPNMTDNELFNMRKNMTDVLDIKDPFDLTEISRKLYLCE